MSTMMFDVRVTDGGKDDSVLDETFHDRNMAFERALEMNQLDSNLAYFVVPISDEAYADRLATLEQAAAALQA